MVRSEVKICGRYRPDPPLSLGTKRLRLVVARRTRNDLISMFVDGSCRGGSQLRLLFGLLFYLSNLLSLGRGRADFHAKNDISNFGLCQRCHVDTKNR